MSRPGEEVAILINWRGYVTVADGLVACQTPNADANGGIRAWNLTHAPTGRTVAYFDGPEQAQAAAAKVAHFDWLSLNEGDPFPAWGGEVLRLLDDMGGKRYPTTGAPTWTPEKTA